MSTSEGVPSSSVPQVSPSSGDKDTKKKRKINVQNDGSVVGDGCEKWSSRSGDLVRAHIPIFYKTWREVPGHFKDDVWNALMGEFTLNVSPEVARPLLEKSWPQKLRTYKNTLRQYLRVNGSSTTGPKGIDPNHWKVFVQNESDPKKKQQNIKNAESRKKWKVTHCLGRRTYAQKMHMKQEKEPERKFRRIDNWFAGHEHDDGSVLASAKDIYDQIKAITKTNNNTNEDGDHYNVAYGSIDNDEVATILGKDINGHVRGIGSNVTKKQFQYLGIAEEKFEQHKAENQKGASKENDMVSRFDSRLNNVEELLKVMLHKHNKESSSASMTTPLCDVDEHLPNGRAPANLYENIENILRGASATSQPSNRTITPTNRNSVFVCNKFGNNLAKGYLVTNETAGTCHFKQLASTEKKVYIEEVYDPDARLWDAPQGGHHTLAGYVEGGFLIWLDCWLKYI